MAEDKKPEKGGEYGRTAYDAVIEIVLLLGRAGPYLVLALVAAYLAQQFVLANNDKMKAVNDAKTEALREHAADIAKLNETIRSNANDFEKLRASQLDSVSKMLELSKSVTSSVIANQTMLAEQRDALEKARAGAEDARRAVERMNAEQTAMKAQLQASQEQQWKAEETIDAARRILRFLGEDVPRVTAVDDLSRWFETVGPEGMAREEDGSAYYGTFRIPAAEMAGFISFIERTEPQIAARLSDAGGKQAAVAGHENFKAEWRSLTRDKVFDALQMAWIEETQYRPFLADLGKALAHGKGEAPAPFPAEKHSLALQAALWSITVQEGRFSPEVRRAWSGLDLGEDNDRALICAIYDERGKIALYRPKVSPATATLLQARYRLERSAALRSLGAAQEDDRCPKRS